VIVEDMGVKNRKRKGGRERDGGIYEDMGVSDREIMEGDRWIYR